MKPLKWPLIVVTLAIAATCILFFAYISNPLNGLPHTGGDPLKNVYVFLYHSMYGHGYWFDAMNYPYGEHIIYNDALPIYSLFITPLHITAEQGLAIIWWTIAISYVIGIIYLYLTLTELHVDRLWAILFACLIAMCSPQLPRINGHYSLSLCCVVPVIFYWTLRYLKTSKWRYPFFLFLWGCILYFIHPYFNGLLLIWELFFCAGYMVFYKVPIKKKLVFISTYLSSIIAISAVIFIYMQLTDPLHDRPKVPWGALECRTHLRDIYTSYVSPFWLLLQKNGSKVQLADFREGYCYIGITTLGVMLLAALLFCFGKLGKSSKYYLPQNDNGENATGVSRLWIFLALGILLVGMGVPFIFKMSWLLKYLPGFRQFRALGRFSWLFYYVITVFGVVILNYWFQVLVAKKRQVAAYSIIVFALLTWCWEASGNVRFVWDLARGGKDNYDWLVGDKQKGWKDFLREKNYSKNDFQAIIPMRYINMGTEKLYLDPSENNLISQVFRASFQLQLPITANYAGRASLSMAEKQIKISDGPFTYKPMLTDSKSDKPFLMLVYECDSLNPDEKYLFQSSEYLGTFSRCSVYAFYPQRCLQSDARWCDSIRKTLPFIQRDSCLGSDNFVIEHFDDKNGKDIFFGISAATAVEKDDFEAGTLKLKPMRDSTLFEFSIWFLISTDDFKSPDVFLKMYDNTGQEVGKEVGIATKCSSDAEGLWFRNSIYFFIPPNCQTIKYRILNYGRASYKAMDELQLRPANAIVISKSSDGKVLVNNHLFRK